MGTEEGGTAGGWKGEVVVETYCPCTAVAAWLSELISILTEPAGPNPVPGGGVPISMAAEGRDRSFVGILRNAEGLTP